METSDSTPDNKWHLDKRVPLALILAIVLQTGAFFGWMAKTDERIANLEKGMANTQPFSERLARIEVMVERLDRSVSDDRRR